MPFQCSICGEESTRICARCTKDTCNNHICEKCLRCSDCCECEVALDETTRPVVHPAPEIVVRPAEESRNGAHDLTAPSDPDDPSL